MTNSRQHPDAPTTKQLNYVKALAEATGGSFTYPKTSVEASREIDRLKSRTRTSRADRRRETRQAREDMATRPGDAAHVRDEELGGYGSSAHWANDSDMGPGTDGAR
jgi:hypothetical protein